MATLLSRKSLIQIISTFLAVMVAEAIGRSGGVWVFIGWFIGGFLMQTPHIVSPQEGNRTVSLILIAVAAGLVGGGVAYTLRNL
jgi:hypothetical protein